MRRSREDALPDDPPVISIDPDPPAQGGSAVITISAHTYPVTLALTWTPSGAGASSVEITSAGGTQIAIPANGVTLKITGGGADAVLTTISP